MRRPSEIPVGVIVVLGPSIPQATILGHSPSGKKQHYRLWLGQEEGFAGEDWEVIKLGKPTRTTRRKAVRRKPQQVAASYLGASRRSRNDQTTTATSESDANRPSTRTRPLPNDHLDARRSSEHDGITSVPDKQDTKSTNTFTEEASPLDGEDDGNEVRASVISLAN